MGQQSDVWLYCIYHSSGWNYMVSFSRLVQFFNRNYYDFYSYSADLIIRTKRIKTENKKKYYSKWVDFKQKMTINILLKTLADLLLKVYQFLISLKNLEESWLNFAEILAKKSWKISKSLQALSNYLEEKTETANI